ncbi:hypothetical protein LXL04_034747 [Taraxacum kok-saghyz]
MQSQALEGQRASIQPVMHNPLHPICKEIAILHLQMKNDYELLGSFENSYIPENPRTPKPLTFSKNRLRKAKNRSNTSPVAKFFFRKNDFFFKNFAYMQIFFAYVHLFFRKFVFATGLVFERFLAPRSRFFEKVNGYRFAMKNYFGRKIRKHSVTDQSSRTFRKTLEFVRTIKTTQEDSEVLKRMRDEVTTARTKLEQLRTRWIVRDKLGCLWKVLKLTRTTKKEAM